MHISDWSSDVCSSDLAVERGQAAAVTAAFENGGAKAVQQAVAAMARGQEERQVSHQSGEQGLAIRSLRQMAGKIERKAVEYRDTPEDRAFIAREMMDMVLHISAKEAAVAAS